MVLDGVIEPFKVQAQQLEELYASKITAIVETEDRLDFPDGIGILFKRKARHLFDVYQLIEDIPKTPKLVDLEMLHNLVLLFGMTRIDRFEYRRGDAIGEYTAEQFERELVPVVPRDAMTATSEEIKLAIRKFFDATIFNWGEPEYSFIESFRKKLFRPEDLFGKGDISSNMKNIYYYKEIMDKVVPVKGMGKKRGKKK